MNSKSAPLRRVGGVWLAAIAVTLAAPLVCAAQSAQDELTLAMSFYRRGEYAASAEAFAGIADRYPHSRQSAQARFYLGESRVELGQNEEAFNAFQAFLGQQPAPELVPRALFRMGETAFQLGRQELAIRLLEQFTLQHPADPLNEFALVYLGELRLQQGAPQLAGRAFERALQQFPNGTLGERNRLGLARALSGVGNVGEASEILDLLSRSADSATAQAALREQLAIEQARGNLAAAEALYERLVATAPPAEAARWKAWRAQVLADAGNLDTARTLWSEALAEAATPAESAAILLATAQAELAAGQNVRAEQALSAFLASYSDQPNADRAAVLLIELKYRNREAEEADRLVQNFTDRYADSLLLPRVREIMARLAYDRNDFEGAVAILSPLCEETDRTADPLTWATRQYLLGLARLGQHDFRAAQATLNEIPDGRLPRELIAMITLARAAASSGLDQPEAAEQAYLRFLQLQPGGPDADQARLQLTRLAVANGDKQLALERFGAWAKRVDDPVAVATNARNLAETADRDGHAELARAFFEFTAAKAATAEQMVAAIEGLQRVPAEDQDLDPDQRDRHLEQLLEGFPNAPETRHAIEAWARESAAQGDHVRAARWYATILESWPESRADSDALLRRAEALQKQGGTSQLRTARELLVDYIQLPNHPPGLDEAHYQLAWIYHDLNMPERSRERFQAVFEQFTESDYWADAAYRFARASIQGDRPDEAAAVLDQVLRNGDAADWHDRLIPMRVQIARNADQWQALIDALAPVARQPQASATRELARYWTAEARYLLGDWVTAEQEFTELTGPESELASELQPWSALRRLECQVRNGNWEDATEGVAEALNAWPDFPRRDEWYLIQGRCFAHDAQFDSAREIFEASIAAAGPRETGAIARWQIGETWFHQQQFESAIKAYERVVRETDHLRWHAAALLQAGKCQEKLGNWPQAVRLYQQLVDKFPDNEFRDDAQKRLAAAERRAARPGSPTR